VGFTDLRSIWLANIQAKVHFDGPATVSRSEGPTPRPACVGIQPDAGSWKQKFPPRYDEIASGIDFEPLEGGLDSRARPSPTYPRR